MARPTTSRLRPERGWARPGQTGTCRLCGSAITREQDGACRTFHRVCSEHWRLTSDPVYVRSRLLERDHGVCCRCGLDCEELRSAVLATWHACDPLARFRTRIPSVLRLSGNALSQFLHDTKMPLSRRSYWDAHHRVAVAEGGGQCGLDNYETVCIWCHTRETAALRKRLSGKGQIEITNQATG